MPLTATNVVNVAAVSNRTGQVKYHQTATVTFDASYVTGGEPLAGSLVGLTNVDFVVVNPRNTGTEVVVWDRAADTLMIFTADGTQATSTSDQSAVTCELLAIGS